MTLEQNALLVFNAKFASVSGSDPESIDDLSAWERKAANPDSGVSLKRWVKAKDHTRLAERNEREKASGLSTAHIPPFFEYYAGASLLKASRGGKCERVGGGKRGKIKGFSYASRRRLMMTIAKIKREAALPMFILLTYPKVFPDPGESKIHLDTFIKRLRRAFPEIGGIWKLEPQKRGAPHYHILAWGASEKELRDFIPTAWYEIAGGGDEYHLQFHRGELGNENKHCVQQVYCWKGVWSYASKYLGKTFEVAGWGEKWTGRFWGVIERENIPFGELVQEETSLVSAIRVMRYQRRFARIRGHDRRSQSIFCDADQWVSKLSLSPPRVMTSSPNTDARTKKLYLLRE